MKENPFLLLALSLFCLSDVSASPSGFHLKSGNARLVCSDGETFLVESGRNAVIEWESFSIARGEKVHFEQAAASSAILNRVTGGDKSTLLGALSSNGAVYLINPHGILIGSESVIQTAGFIASTLDCQGEWEKGVFNFSGESQAELINKGKIQCPSGDVFLIARKVENTGNIMTPQGKTSLLSASGVRIKPHQAPEVIILSDIPLSEEEILENPYAFAIRHRGTIKAENVYCIADKGVCEIRGSIEAQLGNYGGEVRVLADDVRLLNNASIDVSGSLGGGTVLIGGDYQGVDRTIKNALNTWIEKETEVKADALMSGNGGKVIFWGDKSTAFYGKISAQGGNQNGNGGFVEVSGRHLNYAGNTFLQAPNGKTGILLLDPTDITISNSLDSGGGFSGCLSGTNTFSNPISSPTILNTSTLQSNLATCNVLVTTAGSGGGVGNITVSDQVTWNSSHQLSLEAVNNITISAEILNTSTGGISLTTTGATGTTAIIIGEGGSLQTASGDISLNGTVVTDNGFVSHGISITGTGYISTDSGNINLTGSVASGTSSSCGINIAASTNTFISASGSLNLTGTTIASGSHSYGVSITSELELGTSHLTACEIIGSGGVGSSSHGINLDATLTSLGGSGTVSLAGTAGMGSGSFANALGGNIITKGGQISVTGDSILSISPTFDTTDNGMTGGAAISFGGSITGASKNLTLNAGMGAISFSGTIGTDMAFLGDLVTTGGVTTTFADNVYVASATLTGTDFFVGKNFTSTGMLSVTNSGTFTKTIFGVIAVDGGFNTTGNVNQSSDIITTNTPIVIGGNVVISEGGLLSTKGSSGVDLGSNVTISGTLNGSLGGENLAIEAGVGAITFTGAIGNTLPLGSLKTTGGVTTFSNSVDVREVSLTGTDFSLYNTLTTAPTKPVNVTNSGIFRTYVLGAITAPGGFSTSGQATLAANITTSNTPITIGNNLIISDGASITLSTQGGGAGLGSIKINGSIDGTSGESLTLNAGTGTIDFFSSIGASTPLENLTLTHSGFVTFNSTLHITNALTQTQAATGPVVFADTVEVGSATLRGLSYFVGGSFISTGAVSVTNSDLFRKLNVGEIVAHGGCSISGDVSLASNITTTNTPLMVGGNLTIAAATLILSTGAGGGDISIGGTINGNSQALTLNAGNGGNITFNGAIGNSGPIGDLTIENGATILASNLINASSLTQSAGSHTSTFNGAINTSGIISLTGNNFNLNGAVTSGSDVTILNTGLLTIGNSASITVNGMGNFSQSSGLVQIGGPITTTSTAALTGNITLSENMTLTNNVTLTTNPSGTGTITLGGTLEGNYALILEGYEGIFSKRVGGTTPLSSLSVKAPHGITISANQNVSLGPMSYTGTVNLTEALSLINTGTNPIQFTSSSEAITGNHSLTLEAPHTSVTVTGDVVLSGANAVEFNVSAAGNITINGQIRAEGINTNGGEVTLISSLGSVSVHNINTSATGVGNIAGDIILHPTNALLDNGVASGLIVLNEDLSPSGEGNLVAMPGGTVLLSANRSIPSTAATIVSNISGNDFTVHSDVFTMGENEAMSILGNILIDSASNQLGDMVALEAIEITNSVTTLNTHGPYEILANNGLLYISPSLHFIAGSAFAKEGGSYIPSVPGDLLDAQSLELTAATFLPSLLLGNTVILNYDTAPKPIPSPPTPIPSVSPLSQSLQQLAVYQLGIAQAQLSDILPIPSVRKRKQ